MRKKALKNPNEIYQFISEFTRLISLTVNTYSLQYGALSGVPVWVDDEYVGTTPYSGYVSPGSHKIEVPNDLYVHVFQYYYYGSYNYNNPITLSITSDKTVNAYYYSYY